MRKKRTGFILCLLIMCICMPFGIYATQSDVNDAKNKKSSLEEEKKKVESTLKNLESLKADTAAYVKQLDVSLSELSEEISGLSDRIEVKEQEIEVTKTELEKARQTEADQYAAMKLRIQYMYESGETSFIDMLIQAENMSQLLNRAEYVSSISDYDRKMLNQYEEAEKQVKAQEEKLTDEHEELVALKEETEAKQASVQTLLDSKTTELAGYQDKIASAQAEIDDYEKDIKAQEAQIKAIEAEIKRKEEEARKAAEAAGKSYNTVSLGKINFIWPCPASSRISSSFGSRSSPTEGASTNHQGIDIPASTGSSIVAAASGEVIIATYSYSAGNYIMINHGGGVYTVYMHCSQLLVSVGSEVSQGQTIAKVGSTGYSTGSHLHFGIRAGGSYVNPVKYVKP